MVKLFVISGLFFQAAASGIRAQEAPLPDKNRDTLFYPTPAEYLRELSPDRPDKTESPCAVDAGLGYAVTKNVQLDCGGNIGVTRAAAAVNPFAGITVKFRMTTLLQIL